MRKIAVVIDSNFSQNHKWALFPLFLKDFSSEFYLTSSFSSLVDFSYLIFTNINSFVAKKINEARGVRYGLILDGSVDWSDYYSIIAGADFVLTIGGDGAISKIDNVKKIGRINCRKIKNHPEGSIFLVDESEIEFLYQELIDDRLDISELMLLCQSNGKFLKSHDFYAEKFKSIGVNITPLIPNPGVVDSLLESNYFYYYRGAASESVFSQVDNGSSISEIISFILDFTNIEVSKYSGQAGFVNIVCFRPTYLFLDLVRRFEAVGCVHSDYPLEGASSYIWMRPQEIWHYDFLLTNQSHREISVTYQRSFIDFKNKNIDFDDVVAKSVAIHHGTCFEPLYQFDYEKLALSLRRVKSVVGVCEFDECYGPSANIANEKNYSFVPIGYDHNLFNDVHAKKEALKPRQKLKIGFVGRAYGTYDKKQMSVSRLAEPKGYRKGGDILLDVLLRLKAINIPFELHILGQNWEDLVEDLNNYGIDHVYYARDKNITYENYPEIYSKMDALMITARCEGGPVSAIEALSLGVKVISTNVGVVKYLDSIFSENGSCVAVDYDRKWHIADKEIFVKELVSMYDFGRSFEEIESGISLISRFTTDSWVQEIYKKAINISE